MRADGRLDGRAHLPPIYWLACHSHLTALDHDSHTDGKKSLRWEGDPFALSLSLKRTKPLLKRGLLDEKAAACLIVLKNFRAVILITCSIGPYFTNKLLVTRGRTKLNLPRR